MLYEGVDVLTRTLPQLFAALADRGVPAVVVDNSATSEPRSVVTALAEATGCDVTYVARPDNPGFAASANECIALSRSDWVFLVNADVHVDGEHLDAIVQHAEAKRGQNPTAVSLVTDGRHTCGVELDGIGYFSDRPIPSRLLCLGPSGGAAIFNRAQFLAYGGFREDLFAWGEDADLALRMWTDGVVTDELHLGLVHVGGHSLSGVSGLRRKARWLARNRLYMLRADYSRTAQLTLGVAQVALMIANGVRKISTRTAVAHFAGMIDGLSNSGQASPAQTPARRMDVATFRSYRSGSPTRSDSRAR
ncbi:glycosyltransferase family 2 protein [Microbacterium binotii]|uniref:glycosyltransferase family 2 protein n=1 Tax=Microbacterium binotii TaxID=462710 RepID=UPI001F478390|nr:glycosyltransferase [Microbacterium binotii]UIN32291.1 glycosyltransferase [Microbacterium binotii]